MGHREEVVIANVVAARLSSVTCKVFLLIAPHLLCSDNEDHYPEKEDYGQPDTTEHGGVLVDPAQETLEKSPIHDTCERSGYTSHLEGRGAERERESETQKSQRHHQTLIFVQFLLYKVKIHIIQRFILKQEKMAVYLERWKKNLLLYYVLNLKAGLQLQAYFMSLTL